MRLFSGLLLMAAGLLCNEVTAQQYKHQFYIGMYCYDRDGGLEDHVGLPDGIGLDDEYLAELTKYNFNLLISDDPSRLPVTSGGGPDLDFLDRVQNARLRIILGNGDNFYVTRCTTAHNASMTTYGLNYYNQHPAVLGYSISDEPRIVSFNTLGQVTDQIVASDPEKLSFVNLLPDWAAIQNLYDCDPNTEFVGTYETYVDQFIANGHAKVLCFDYYPLGTDPIGCGWQRSYFKNLDLVSRKATINDIPFYLVMNAYQAETGTNCASTNTFHHISDIRLYRYNIFSALMYGAKGLLYWPREVCFDYTYPSVIFSAFDDLQPSIKEELGDVHKNLLEHGNELERLTYEESFHVTELPRIADFVPGAAPWLGQLYTPQMQWSQFANSPNTQAIFSLTSNAPPILPAPTTNFVGATSPYNPTDYLAISYLHDAGNKKYVWVFNKDYNATSSSTFTLNFNGQKNVVDILEDRICCNINSIQIELEPGEGKLLLIDSYFFQTQNISMSFPDLNFTIAAENINLLGNQITGTSVDRFYASNIVVSPAAFFQAGTDVILKAENYICGIFHRPEIMKALKAAPDLNVIPNPNDGHFSLKIDGDSEVQYLISVETLLGQVLLRTNQTGNTLAEIDLSALPDGMYLIKLAADGDVVKTVKTIVNH